MGRKTRGELLKHVLLERLMHYYYFLGERPDGDSPETVSSGQIAKFLNMDDTLVRKDLAAIGVRGHPRIGFKTREVIEAIRDVLGFDTSNKAIVVGAGRLGGALAAYSGFAKCGLFIVAAFDSDPLKQGTVLAGTVVQPMENVESVILRHNVKLALLTVPAEPAQAIADRLIRAGIKAIWNFAPTAIVAPQDVVVRHEHIAAGLAELAYHLKNLRDTEGS